MVYNATIDLIIKTIRERNLSYETIAEKANIGKTTVYRLVKNRDASAYTIGRVVAYLEIGEEVRKLDEDERPGEDEIHERERELRAYYEAKAMAVRQHYDQQVQMHIEQNQRQQEERELEREMHQQNYAKVVNYLKEENDRLRRERDEARASAGGVAQKKHYVYRIMATLCIILGVTLAITIVLLFFALKSDAIM